MEDLKMLRDGLIAAAQALDEMMQAEESGASEEEKEIAMGKLLVRLAALQMLTDE